MPKGVKGFQRNNKLGKKFTLGHKPEWRNESRIKLSNSMRGHPVSNATRNKIRDIHLGAKRIVGEKHWMWKGDTVSYSGIHSWVRRRFGTPETCEKCGKTGLSGHFIQWANISGKYKRERSDWLRLCSRCHLRRDRKLCAGHYKNVSDDDYESALKELK